MLSQFDSQCWANLTLNVELSTLPDRILVTTVSQLFLSVYIIACMNWTKQPPHDLRQCLKVWRLYQVKMTIRSFFSQCNNSKISLHDNLGSNDLRTATWVLNHAIVANVRCTLYTGMSVFQVDRLQFHPETRFWWNFDDRWSIYLRFI